MSGPEATGYVPVNELEMYWPRAANWHRSAIV